MLILFWGREGELGDLLGEGVEMIIIIIIIETEWIFILALSKRRRDRPAMRLILRKKVGKEKERMEVRKKRSLVACKRRTDDGEEKKSDTERSRAPTLYQARP
jgi:hypothetical protein